MQTPGTFHQSSALLTRQHVLCPLPSQANVVQANMLSNQTKAALLQLEVELTDDDDHRIVSISAHVWRAELLTGVLEVDKTQTIVKAGCCPLHQPGVSLLGDGLRNMFVCIFTCVCAWVC